RSFLHGESMTRSGPGDNDNVPTFSARGGNGPRPGIRIRYQGRYNRRILPPKAIVPDCRLFTPAMRGLAGRSSDEVTASTRGAAYWLLRVSPAVRFHRQYGSREDLLPAVRPRHEQSNLHARHAHGPGVHNRWEFLFDG